MNNSWRKEGAGPGEDDGRQGRLDGGDRVFVKVVFVVLVCVRVEMRFLVLVAKSRCYGPICTEVDNQPICRFNTELQLGPRAGLLGGAQQKGHIGRGKVAHLGGVVGSLAK